MQTHERSFVLRFSVRAEIPDALLEDEEFEESAHLVEWERSVKPAMLRAIFEVLRSADGWTAHVRNRGASIEDEIEVVAERDFSAGRPSGNA